MTFFSCKQIFLSEVYCKSGNSTKATLLHVAYCFWHTEGCGYENPPQEVCIFITEALDCSYFFLIFRYLFLFFVIPHNLLILVTRTPSDPTSVEQNSQGSLSFVSIFCFLSCPDSILDFIFISLLIILKFISDTFPLL